MVHGILFIQLTCSTVLSDNLFPGPLWSSLWSAYSVLARAEKCQWVNWYNPSIKPGWLTNLHHNVKWCFLIPAGMTHWIQLQIWLSVISTHTHTRLTALFPGLPGWAGTRKVKPIWILLKQQSGWQWHQLGICKSAPRSRQITTPAPHHSVFYRLDALPADQQRQSTEGSYQL